MAGKLNIGSNYDLLSKDRKTSEVLRVITTDDTDSKPHRLSIQLYDQTTGEKKEVMNFDARASTEGDVMPDLNETSSGNQVIVRSEDMIEGATYTIKNTNGDTVDYTNYGAANNDTGTEFVYVLDGNPVPSNAQVIPVDLPLKINSHTKTVVQSSLKSANIINAMFSFGGNKAVGIDGDQSMTMPINYYDNASASLRGNIWWKTNGFSYSTSYFTPVLDPTNTYMIGFRVNEKARYNIQFMFSATAVSDTESGVYFVEGGLRYESDAGTRNSTVLCKTTWNPQGGNFPGRAGVMLNGSGITSLEIDTTYYFQIRAQNVNRIQLSVSGFIRNSFFISGPYQTQGTDFN